MVIDDNWSPGADGQPGHARVNDDGHGDADDDFEAGWAGSDDARLEVYSSIVGFLRTIVTRGALIQSPRKTFPTGRFGETA